MWLSRINQIRMTRRAEYFAHKYGIKDVRKVALVLQFMRCQIGKSESECFREACLKHAMLEIQAVIIARVVMGQI